MPYQQIKTFSLDEILPLINNSSIKHPDGYKLDSQRLRVFKRSQTCVCCGLEASFFRAENFGNCITPHLNMYGIIDGNDILFTKDHIIPKSKGGRDIMENFQTMCSPCNLYKGNKMIIV